MFAIYNVEGRRFRDTLEKLHKVRESQASAKTPLWSSLTEEEARHIPVSTNAENKTTPLSSKAVQAYREMRHLNQREPIYHAYQLMSYPVSTTTIEMDIVEAQRYFRAHKHQQMPVMSAQRRIVGMLSLVDLLRFIVIDDGQLHYVDGKRVADAMSREVITTDPVSDIRRVAQVMLEYHLNAVPIVDGQDTLIGIVSRSDILRAVMNDPPLTMWS